MADKDSKLKKIVHDSNDQVINMNQLQNEINRTEDLTDINIGVPTTQEFILPSSFERGHTSYLKVGEKYVRCFFLVGFPNYLEVTQLRTLYDDINYDIDISLRIEPGDTNTQLNKLTRRLTDAKAYLNEQISKGNIRDQQATQTEIDSLEEEIAKLESDYSHFYLIQFIFNLYADSLKELNQKSKLLDQTLKAHSFHIQSCDYRQDAAYKTILPVGTMYVFDKPRNFNTAALSALFPFYNAELLQAGGIYIGKNELTNSPTIVNFFNKNQMIATGYNIFIAGKTGFGKTYTLDLLTARSALQGIRTVIVDPENEFHKLVKSLGGKEVILNASNGQMINMFDVEESFDYDRYGEIKRTLDLKGKISDLQGLIAVMMGNDISSEEAAAVAEALQLLYNNFGIKDGDPESLYEEVKYYNSPLSQQEDNRIMIARPKKKMPIFSDFMKVCQALYQVSDRYPQFKKLERIINSLRVYTKKGIYGAFDTETSKNLREMTDSPLIVFNVSGLEDTVLKPVGMYLTLTWIWEKFAKKNPEIYKRVICDEAWLMLKSSSNNQNKINYSAEFLRNLARRARKYNVSLTTASQELQEFVDNDAGRDVLQQSSYQILLHLDVADADNLKNYFRLSDGEVSYVIGARRGEALIRVGDHISCITTINGFDVEDKMVDRKNNF